MGEAEFKIFIVLATIILLVFINGIIIFIFQYRKRKVLHEKEKELLHVLHTQKLLDTQLEIQEQTMQDIGREIHDNVGQRLTLASIYTNQLAYEGRYPLIDEQVTTIANIINESLAELRALSKSLTQSNADAGELESLLQNECNRVNGLKTCHASLSGSSSGLVISSVTKNFVLRIVQEFIQNSLKHADCKHLRIDLAYTDAGLTLSAQDDGKGFDMNVRSKNADKGIGLVNIRKRAALIGAEIAVNSTIDKGTTLNLFIPADKLITY